MKFKQVSEQMDVQNLDSWLPADNDFDFQDIELDLSDLSLTDYDELLFNPTHVSIDPDTTVNLVQDANVLKTDTWANVISWINDNWPKLSGRYDVSKDGQSLYDFTISH